MVPRRLSAVKRLGFLALDRRGVHYAAKGEARGMAKPLIRHQGMLPRCAT